MFKFLKDKLKKAISIFSKKVEKEVEITEIEKISESPAEPEIKEAPEEEVEKIVKKEPKKKEKYTGCILKRSGTFAK